jgi:hypothetical protein
LRKPFKNQLMMIRPPFSPHLFPTVKALPFQGFVIVGKSSRRRKRVLPCFSCWNRTVQRYLLQ